jgi:hypothetical protein
MSVTNRAHDSETQQAASVGIGSGGDGVPVGFILVRVVEDGVEGGVGDCVEDGVGVVDGMGVEEDGIVVGSFIPLVQVNLSTTLPGISVISRRPPLNESGALPARIKSVNKFRTSYSFGHLVWQTFHTFHLNVISGLWGSLTSRPPLARQKRHASRP